MKKKHNDKTTFSGSPKTRAPKANPFNSGLTHFTRGPCELEYGFGLHVYQICYKYLVVLIIQARMFSFALMVCGLRAQCSGETATMPVV